ncbi:MAG: type II secretion system protein [Patescibacteria group bacterium]
MKKNKQGFTLIELLVVIAIIGLLATLSVVALNSARVKSRDAKRLSDIRQIQTGLELYFDEASKYPTNAIAATLSSGGDFASTASGTVYLGRVPTNPTPVNDGICSSSAAYTYTQWNSGASYTLSYCLSDIGNSTATPTGIK